MKALAFNSMAVNLLSQKTVGGIQHFVLVIHLRSTPYVESPQMPMQPLNVSQYIEAKFCVKYFSCPCSDVLGIFPAAFMKQLSVNFIEMIKIFSYYYSEPGI